MEEKAPDIILASYPHEYKLKVTAITVYILPSYMVYMAQKYRLCFESGLCCINPIFLMLLISAVSSGSKTHTGSVKYKAQKDGKLYFMC